MERVAVIRRGIVVLALSAAAGLAGGWLLLRPSAAPGAAAYSFQPPASKTNAPSEGLCTECHTGGLNVTGGSLEIQGVPAAYQPGTTYSLTVQLQKPGQQRWGFELTALRDSAGVAVQAGSFANTTDFTAVQMSPVNARNRLYVSHYRGIADGTYLGTLDGPVTWTFDWTAPAPGAGTVTFYAAGNAANGNLVSGAGDYIYTRADSTSENAPTAVSSTTWGRIKRIFQSR
ncbi:MAG: choice-of-anchor V domain-containing protein [Hyphomicrobiales bacterium]